MTHSTSHPLKDVRTPTLTLATALTLLSREVESQDGVPNAAMLEGAMRIMEMHSLLKRSLPLLTAQAQLEAIEKNTAKSSTGALVLEIQQILR